MKQGKTEGRRRGRQQRIRWLDDVTDSIHMSLNKPWEMVRDREAWPAVSMGLQRVGHDVVTEQQQQPTMGIMKSTQLKHIQDFFFFFGKLYLLHRNHHSEKKKTTKTTYFNEK